MHEDKRNARSRPPLILGIRGFLPVTTDICAQLGVSPGQCNNEPFPNGEATVQMIDDIRGKDVFVIASLCRQHEPDQMGYTGVNDAMAELLIFGDTLCRASAQRVTAVLPNIGYARQDRKAAGRTPISSRLVADLIVEAGFNRVLTMDLHSDQVQGFFPRSVPLDHLSAAPLFAKHLSAIDIEAPVILAPDLGSLKRADKYRAAFPGPVGLAVIDKRRDDRGGVHAKQLIGDVRERTVLIVDDIISTGTTVAEAIDLAIENGANGEIYVAATHGEFVGGAVERLRRRNIKAIYITDSIPALPHMQELPIRIVSIAELFAKAILRIHKGESISELLRTCAQANQRKR